MKTFEVGCDIASVKVFTKDVAFHFRNGWGDHTTRVDIWEDPKSKDKRHPRNGGSKAEFLDCFEVYTEAHLSSYDCSRDPIYTFKLGRWFVYRIKPLHLAFCYLDDWGCKPEKKEKDKGEMWVE